jgi:hypothetical protein
VDTV